MGQALTFVVSNYDKSTTPDDGSATLSPVTYLTVGAARSTTDEPPTGVRGDELIGAGTGDSYRGLVFKDDLRDAVAPGKTYYRDDGTGRVAQSDRTDLTGDLLTRGGWRDHTDGNRISTTRGDCVDVVYGNYKLVVLGRVASEWSPSGQAGLGDAGNTTVNTALSHSFWESSGGHNVEGTSAEGKVVSCIYAASEEGGGWQTLEQTDSGDKKVVYRGYYESETYGPSITRYVGKGTAAMAIDGGENTAAAHAADKPAVTRTTYARSIDHQDKIDKLEERITSSGGITERFDVKGSYQSSRTFERVDDFIGCGAFRRELFADNIDIADTYVSNMSVRAGIVSVSFCPIGMRLTAKQGSRTRFWFTPFALRVQGPFKATVNIGMHTDIRPGASLEVGDFGLRLHATFDLFGYLWGGVKWLFKAKGTPFKSGTRAELHQNVALGMLT